MAIDVFQTPFPPEECKRRLEAATEKDLPLLSDWKFTTGVLGRIHDDTFRLRVRRAMWRNSFDRLFYGRFETTPTGALVRGKFRLHPFVLVFSLIWFTGVIAIGGSILVLSLATLITHRPYVEGDVLGGILVPLVMLVFGIALFWLGRRWSYSCEERLRTFICETLNARRVGPAA